MRTFRAILTGCVLILVGSAAARAVLDGTIDGPAVTIP